MEPAPFDLAALLGGLMVFFMIFILPLWLFLHYRYYTSRHAGELAAAERDRLEALAAEAAQLQTRLATVEKILDGFDPEWRNS